MRDIRHVKATIYDDGKQNQMIKCYERLQKVTKINNKNLLANKPLNQASFNLPNFHAQAKNSVSFKSHKLKLLRNFIITKMIYFQV